MDVSDINISVTGSDDASEMANYYSSVLIADDDMVQLNGLKGQVKYVKGPDGNDQICECAHSGNQLIDLYKKRLAMSLTSDVNPFKVIITDLHMPGMNGF